MKSVGEAMAIGRTFKESLQKCLRSLEIGRSGLGGDGKPWRIGTEVYGDRDILPRDVISRKLRMHSYFLGRGALVAANATGATARGRTCPAVFGHGS